MKSYMMFVIAIILLIMSALLPVFPIPEIAFFILGVGFGMLIMEFRNEKSKML